MFASVNCLEWLNCLNVTKGRVNTRLMKTKHNRNNLTNGQHATMSIHTHTHTPIPTKDTANVTSCSFCDNVCLRWPCLCASVEYVCVCVGLYPCKRVILCFWLHHCLFVSSHIHTLTLNYDGNDDGTTQSGHLLIP